MFQNPFSRIFALCVLALASFKAPAHATSYLFDGGTDNTWQNSQNWLPPGVPGDGDSATVPAGGTVFLLSDVTVANLSTGGQIHSGINVEPSKGPSLTVTARYDWSSGYIGQSLKSFTIGPDAVCVFSGDEQKTYAGQTFNNEGRFEWTGTGKWQFYGTFNNSGTFLALQPTYFGASGYSTAFNNTGEVIRRGSGVFSLNGHDGNVYFSGTFNNFGKVRVESGTMQIGPGSSTGIFGVSSGARLLFNDIHKLNATPLNGQGNYVFKGPYDFIGIQFKGNIPLNGATIELQDGVLAGGFEGETGSTGTLAGTGKLVWTKGRLAGNLTLDVGIRTTASGQDITTSRNKSVADTVKNKGIFNWLGGAPLESPYGTFINAGTFNVKAAGVFFIGTNADHAHFENRGILNTFAGENSMDYTLFSNSGLLNLGGDGGVGTLSTHRFVLASTGTWRLDLAGRADGQFDRISGVLNDSTIGGTIDVRLQNDFAPADATFLVASRTQFNGTPLGAWNRVVKPAGYAVQTSTDTTNAYLRIGRAHKISGRAFKTLANGVQQGISGVTITRIEGTTSVSATTNANGNYSFKGLFAGTYTVSASKTGIVFDPASKTIVLPTTGQTASPNGVANFKTYFVSGTILNDAGRPVLGVPVTLSGAAAATTTTDANGFYRFKNLGGGSYTVTPAQSGFSFAPTSREFVLPKTAGGNPPNALANFTKTKTPTGSNPSAKSQ